MTKTDDILLAQLDLSIAIGNAAFTILLLVKPPITPDDADIEAHFEKLTDSLTAAIEQSQRLLAMHLSETQAESGQQG